MSILRLPEYKAQFDPHLAFAFSRIQADIAALSEHVVVRESFKQAERIALGSGKRFRPYAAYLGYRTAGGNDLSEVVTHLGLGIELFHAFILMHDDVMDRSSLRHGQQTVHTLLAQDMDLFTAQAQAIIVGDCLYSYASECIMECGVPQVAMDYHRMIREVCVGQMLDVDMTIQTEASKETITRKTLLKTADYTFVRPLCMGAGLVGLTAEMREFFTAYGTALGFAFQLQDDLLDVSSTEEEAGKPVFSDGRQHTLLTHFVREHGSAEDIACLERHAEGSVSHQEIAEIFQRTGAIEYVESEAARYVNDARTALEHFSMNDELKQAWVEITDLVAGRRA